MAFIRRKKVKGKVYLQLVENYREGGKVRQRVIQHLGTEAAAGVSAPIPPPPDATIPPAIAPLPLPTAPLFPVGTDIWFQGVRGPEKGAIAGWDGKWLTIRLKQRGLISETRIKPDRVMGRQFAIGDWVCFTCELGGMEGPHYGTVIESDTQSSACAWPRWGRRAVIEVVRIPHEVPGMVSIRYQWLTHNCVTQLPVSKVWYPGGSPPHWQGMGRKKVEFS
jgi:hypothetical protein